MKKSKKQNSTTVQDTNTQKAPVTEIKKEVNESKGARPTCESNDDDTDWQTMLWEVTKDARKLYDGISTLCLSYTEKQDAIAEVAEITYDDPAMMIEHIKMMAKRLCQVPGFRAYCSKLGVGPDCVAQHIIFDGYAKVKAIIERGLEPVYGETIVLFSMPIVGYELE